MQLTKYKRLPYPINLWSSVLDDETPSDKLPPDWEKTISYLYDSLGNSQHRSILQDYFKNMLSWEEISTKHDLSRERVRQIAELSIRRLRQPSMRWILVYGLSEARNMRIDHRGNWSAAPTEDSDAQSPDETPVSELNLSPRSHNCLRRSNIFYIGQLLQHSEGDLLQLRNMGPHCVQEIKNQLADRGMTLKLI